MIDSIGAANGTTKAASPSARTLGYDAFLNLLVTELRNQDPTNPMDATQQLSQLASFSAVEQMTKSNSKLDELLTATRLETARGMIGERITSADGKTQGTVTSVRFDQGNIVAKLADGHEIVIGDGVVLGGGS